MEAKLKALRVADLRDILQKASVSVPAKSNKSDLVSKILASPAALEAFANQGSSAVPAPKPKAPESSQGGQDDDLLAPPEEFDWGSASAPNGGPSTVEVSTASASKPSNAKPAAPITSSQPEKQSASQQPLSSTAKAAIPSNGAAGVSHDDETEKRKNRAARFNIPLVEAKPKAALASNGAKTSTTKAQVPPGEEANKLDARAARFGIPKSSPTNASTTGQKRARSPAPVDTEEVEKRKKRAERFSTDGGEKAQA